MEIDNIEETNNVIENTESIEQSEMIDNQISTYDLREHEVEFPLKEQFQYNSTTRDKFYEIVNKDVSIKDSFSKLIVREHRSILTYIIPNEYSKDLIIIDNQLYNLGSETIRLCSADRDNISTSDMFHILIIPPYGSEEYYYNLSEWRYQSNMQENPQAYRAISVCTFDDETALVCDASGLNSPSFEIVDGASSMYSWDTTTIFVFIILIILICKTIFRKGGI